MGNEERRGIHYRCNDLINIISRTWDQLITVRGEISGRTTTRREKIMNVS